MFKNLFRFSLCFVVTSVILAGCGGHQRVLSVKSEPAEAEICIKGKHGSRYFSSTKKTCIGSTPFEADTIEITDKKGEVREVSFSDVEDDRENFYLIVTRPGYATQSMQVPAWEHFIALKPDATAPGAGGNPIVIQTGAQAPVASAAPAQDLNKGSIKLTSNPVGALVYVNDVLKGNTPYVIDGAAGSTVRVKLEQNGYKSIERSLVIDGGKSLDLSLALVRDGVGSDGSGARGIASERRETPAVGSPNQDPSNH